MQCLAEYENLEKTPKELITNTYVALGIRVNDYKKIPNKELLEVE